MNEENKILCTAISNSFIFNNDEFAVVYVYLLCFHVQLNHVYVSTKNKYIDKWLSNQ